MNRLDDFLGTSFLMMRKKAVLNAINNYYKVTSSIGGASSKAKSQSSEA
jgi:hypothetical protein